jgi:hypothetical protein
MFYENLAASSKAIARDTHRSIGCILTALWGMEQCSLVGVSRLFGSAYFRHCYYGERPGGSTHHGLRLRDYTAPASYPGCENLKYSRVHKSLTLDHIFRQVTQFTPLRLPSYAWVSRVLSSVRVTF